MDKMDFWYWAFIILATLFFNFVFYVQCPCALCFFLSNWPIGIWLPVWAILK